MRPLVKKALEAIRKQGGRVIDHARIEATLREIGKEYRPGLIRWIKEQPDQWGRLLTLEDQINKAALVRDEIMLTGALSEYRDFFTEMVNWYEGKGEAQREKEQRTFEFLERGQ